MLHAIQAHDPFLAKSQTSFSLFSRDPVDEMMNGCGESFVCVSTQKPYKLLDVSREWLDLFQFSREEVSGRALRVFSGPNTNLLQLDTLIQRVREGKEAQGCISFYTSSGVAKPISVKLFPSSLSSESCIIEMREAITILPPKVAEDVSNFGGSEPSVILSTDKPFSIQRVNHSFCAMFGMTPQMTTNRTLRVICGPLTNTQHLQTMLQNAQSGFSQCATLHLYDTGSEELVCSVRVRPGVDANGNISCMLVTLTLLNSHPAHLAQRGADSVPSAVAPNQRVREAFTPGPLRTYGENELDSLTHSMEASLAIRASHAVSLAAPQVSYAKAPATPWDQRPPSLSASSSSASLPPSSAPPPSAVPCIAPAGSSAQASPTPSAMHPMLPRETPPDSFPLQPPHSRSSPPAAAERASSAGSSSSSAPAASHAGGEASLRLIPRKKGAVTSPVQLSVQLLKDMGVMSMRKAAEELGIAPSTLKKACRKLGMKRWLHSPSAAPIQQHAMDYNSAYVRSLHTKYAAKRSASAASPDSESGWGGTAEAPGSEWAHGWEEGGLGGQAPAVVEEFEYEEAQSVPWSGMGLGVGGDMGIGGDHGLVPWDGGWVGGGWAPGPASDLDHSSGRPGPVC